MTVIPINAGAQPYEQGTERWLDELHIEWVYDPAVAVERVDQAASLANQARFEPLNAEVVDRYTADIARGDHFPPLLMAERSRKRHLILGGNHRFAAHLANKATTVAAYVITVAPEMALRLTYEDNRRHGLPPSEAERIAQAIHLVDNGWTARDAAACVGVTEGRMSLKRSVVKVGRRADDLAVDRRFHALAETSRYQLSHLRSDPVFTAAAKLVLDADLNSTDVKQLVANCADTSSDAAAIAVIDGQVDELRDRIQKGAGGKARTQRTPRTRLDDALNVIRSLDAAEVVASCPDADVRRKLADRIVTTAGVMQKLVGRLR